MTYSLKRARSWFTAAIALTTLAAALHPAVGQTPKPKPKPPKSAPPQGATPSAPRIKLLLTPDAPCTVTVNGESIGRIEGDEVRAVPAAVGDNLIQARSTDEADARWDTTQKIPPGETQVVVKIAMRERINAIRSDRATAAAAEARDSTLIDGLQWLKKDNGEDVDWNAAKGYCENLTLIGHHDWRLPTISELEKIYDASSSADYKVRGGIKLTSCCLWSSTLKDSSSAWVFNFSSVERFIYQLVNSFNSRALCVRVPRE